MFEDFSNEPLMEIFLHETSQLIEKLEQSILEGEKDSSMSTELINEIFRIMHTVKGSAAMMMFHNIATLAHTMEDLFSFLRSYDQLKVNYLTLGDLVLEGIDYIKLELEKIKNGDQADGEIDKLVIDINIFLNNIKEVNEIPHIQNSSEMKITQEDLFSSIYIKPEEGYNIYRVKIYFEDGCEMENIRAFGVIHNLKDISSELYYSPENILENLDSIDVIRNEGFQIILKTDETLEEMDQFFQQIIYLKSLEITQVLEEEQTEVDTLLEDIYQKPLHIGEIIAAQAIGGETSQTPVQAGTDENRSKEITIKKSVSQSMISVTVGKLDKMMDLVGEMVIAEAMVVQNPDLYGLELGNFQKAAQQLHKITTEIQDIVMSMRMVPLSGTFQKMTRIVRDMNRKLGKDVRLEIIGEETEVDKNIIEHLSDPIMHLVRNALDHGIEHEGERVEKGKKPSGTLTLEARNVGNDVMLLIKDDGKGLNRDIILKKANEKNILYKSPEEMSDREVFNMILLPGFSTKEEVSEFSGRGVGMDVVAKNIESVGGTISIESTYGEGTTMIMKIPLTLAIIEGMNVKVGESYYTIPLTSIRESFRPSKHDIIIDPNGNEMVMVRGNCYAILRLHEKFQTPTNVKNFDEGILVMVEVDEQRYCVFVDALMGQQQVVVKALPTYISRFNKNNGLSGCTLLGDGSISLIIDLVHLFHH